MSQLDFTLYMFHYLDLVTIFYFFMSSILFVLVGQSINTKGSKKG